MSLSTMLLTLLAILIFCGLLQRVLDRMHLTDRQALLIVGAMLAGTFLPDLRIGPVSIHPGGALIPLGVCVYLFIRADEPAERWRAILGSILTAGAVYALGRLLPAEAEAMWVDPMWLYGLAGGVIAWAIGRSRRCAFICGVAGVILADIVTYAVSAMQGYSASLVIGGAGIADAIVISGALAVFMCELVGESIERLARAKARR